MYSYEYTYSTLAHLLGLNMTLNSSLLQNSISSSVNSTSSLADMQSSRYSSNLMGNSSNAGGTRQQSPLSSDLPGPSGIGPMQHAPLVRILLLFY